MSPLIGAVLIVFLTFLCVAVGYGTTYLEKIYYLLRDKL